MKLANVTWPKIAGLPRETPILFPVAALEQHGHHMPTFTDSLLAGEIVRRLEDEPRFGEKVLFAPLQWLGNSDHHLDFPGTLSAPPRVYLDLLAASVENFLRHGFKRFLFLNGHGGNDVPGKQVVFELRQKHREIEGLLLLFATYWNLAPDAGKAHPDLVQDQMGHACEWETSMMLRIRPELVVGEVSQLETVPFGNSFEPASRGWTMKDRSVPGHIGSPEHANADKGERLLQHFTAGAAKLLDRVLAWDGQSWEG